MMLRHLVIRIPKEQSAFFYFTLESHEGLCFYSTLPHTAGETHRDIDVKSPESLNREFDLVIQYLLETIGEHKILLDELVKDSFHLEKELFYEH